MTEPRISVIVPAFNARDTIADCLAAIRAQVRLEPGELELIVVDDGSTDGSAEAASGLADKVIRLESNRGAAAARNRGAGEARGNLLVFVDADVYLEPNALSLFKRLFEERPAISAAVGRYTERPAAPGLVNFYHNAFTRFHHDLSPPEIDWFWGALSAVKKDAFERAGGFDERYQGASAEDMEFGGALVRAGFRIVYFPPAAGAHAHDFGFFDMLANDYKKAALGMKLMLLGRLPGRAPSFASAENVLVLAFLLTLPAVIFVLPWFAIVLYLLVWFLCFRCWMPFNSRLARDFKGVNIALQFGLYFSQLPAILAGAVAGAVGLLLGRSPFGKPGWW